jgi:hypothetical protein
MVSAIDYSARGRVKEINGDTLVFLPAGTTYELHLKLAGGAYTGPLDRPVDALIRCQARKIWTVPSGGNFVQPIFGQPRIIQGRVEWLDEKTLVVRAGATFIVEVPTSSAAIDLANGAIEAGAMVNVTVLPGAAIEVCAKPAGV